jgi:hypothetical protein
MNTVTISNLLEDDKLIDLLKSNFTKNDMELFELNYKIYTSNKNNLDDFIVDFDDIWNWIGFSTKGHAKRLLESKNIQNKSIFDIDKDYVIMITPKGNNSRGPSKHRILLTVHCFKKFCLKASTQQSEKIYDYYIKMENIITKYIENKHNEIIENNNKIVNESITLLKIKDQEIQNNNKIVKIKDQEIQNNIKIINERTTLLKIKDQEIINNYYYSKI